MRHTTNIYWRWRFVYHSNVRNVQWTIGRNRVMSRNRNIRNNIAFTTPIPPKTHHTSCLLGKKSPYSKSYFDIVSNLCGCSSAEECSTNVAKSDGLGTRHDTDNGSFLSSSSLSWDGEYEQDYTNRVDDELRLMERVLNGSETIPLNFDHDEYKLWLRTFPDSSFNFTKRNNKVASSSTKNLDTPMTTRKSRRKRTHMPDFVTKFEDVLQISSMALNDSRGKSLVRGKKRHGSTVTLTKEEDFDDADRVVAVSPQFNSLPQIALDNNFVGGSSHSRSSSFRGGSSSLSYSAKMVFSQVDHRRKLRSNNNTNRASRTRKQQDVLFLPPLKSGNNRSSGKNFGDGIDETEPVRAFSISHPRRSNDRNSGVSATTDIFTLTKRFEGNRRFFEKYNRSLSMNTSTNNR